MEIEIQLQKVLRDHHLDSPGIISIIAREIGRHRNSVAALYHNESQNPPLDVLGLVANWLQRRGVRSGLPGILFGKASARLWSGVTSPGMVTMYLGEQTQPNVNISWISRRDAMVEMEIISHLSTKAQLEAVCVPFRAEFAAKMPKSLSRRVLTEHQKRARELFEAMRAELPRSSAILIGSPRANYLLEALIADLFGCVAFKADRRRINVPFHFGFRTPWRDIESCCGGLHAPVGDNSAFKEGMYFLDSNRRWNHRQTVRGKVDSGIVLTCYEPGARGLQLAIAGVSGQATEAMGRSLTLSSKAFWPPYAEHKGRKLGVYVCHFKLSQESNDPNAKAYAQSMEVIPIDKDVLAEYLR